MLCLRCSKGFGAVATLPLTSMIAPLKVTSKRTFTSLTPLRPTIFASAFRPLLSASPSTTTSLTATGEAALDLLPKISTHPALGATQVRCGPRNTFNPSHFVRKRRHGFLSRIRTRKGRATLTRRKLKKRSTLSH